MAARPCYAGGNPIQDPDERMAVWKWAKENGIDAGLPYEKVHDAINNHFFGGVGRPEWTHEILGGRKTPFRQVSDAAWAAQRNRRAAVGYAKEQIRQQTMSPAMRAFGKAWGLPREVNVFWHDWVFPMTHAGDLLMRPTSWGHFFGLVRDVYSKSFSAAETEQLMDRMRRDPLYRLAVDSGLAIGRGSHVGGLADRPSKAWDILTKTRFDMWKSMMEKRIDPKMSSQELLDYGRNFADWANHATGSTKSSLMMGKTPLGGLFFGPSLTASRISRLIGDPAKTVATFANWNKASPGEQQVALTRLSGLGQFFGMYMGALIANAGYNQATGGTPINYIDPRKKDWLNFNAGGIKFGLGQMATEIRTLGKILAIPWTSPKAMAEATGGTARDPSAYFLKTLMDYGWGKVAPTISFGKELITGQEFTGRPLPVPWAPQPTVKKPKMDWAEYFLTARAPILMEEPAKYIYDHLREHGASAFDAQAIIKGLIVTGMGATGIHVSEPPSAEEKAALNVRAKAEASRRRQIARQLRGR
jgi:hypothetical protein